MRPPEEVKKVLVRQWLAKAEQDLKASEALLDADPPLLYAACFHAQQAVEKYLKGLLTWLQVEFPKTHVIETLLDILSQADSTAASSLSEACELTPYGVDVRYPADQPEPTLDDSHRAVELARKVEEAVTGMLPFA